MPEARNPAGAQMRLYYSPQSSNSRRALLVARHLGAPIELVVIDLRNPADRARLVALNPNSKIPVLEHGDFVLWESRAIMQYLADQVPGQTIYPADLRQRADVNRWLFWCAHHWAPAIGIFTWEHVIKPYLKLGDPDPQAIERGKREFGTVARVLDGHLAGRDWLAGSGLSIVDFGLATPLMRAVEAQVPVAEHANIAAWLARVQGFEAWKATQP